MLDFEAFFAAATGYRPYRYQARLAEEGLPGSLWAPTGTGKTGVILAWLWRRLHGPDPAAVPLRLVYALPQRALADQLAGRVRTWLANLGLVDDVALHVVLGSRASGFGDWREDPHRAAIVLGTAETLVSKALLRGYGAGRTLAPIDFALVTNGAWWVVDEAGLCPAAGATLRRLAGWAGEWGTMQPFGMTFCSALPVGGGSGSVIAGAERTGEIAVRLGATRTIRRARVAPGDYAGLASWARSVHQARTTTLVVLNGVGGAQAVYRELSGVSGVSGVSCSLVHSQLREVERAAVLAELSPAGRIVVASSDVAAGLDLSAATVVAEASSWASMVRVAGRCNRDGDAADGSVWWVPPAGPASAGVAVSCASLEALENAAVTGEDLAVRASPSDPDGAGLTSAEFLALFDTGPAGTPGFPDIDVTGYVCDSVDVDVEVAWATWTPGPEGAPDPEVRYPEPEYRCRVPMSAAARLAGSRPVWRYDRAAGGWVRVASDWSAVPFEQLLVAGADGGYDPLAGFDRSARVAVAGCPELLTPAEVAARDTAEAEVAVVRPWQSLDEHSRQVRDQAGALLTTLQLGISPPVAAAVIVAGYLHDVGKAHATWQDALCALADPDEAAAVGAGRPWAKSGKSGALLFADGVSFRHELASLLFVDGPLAGLLSESLVESLRGSLDGVIGESIGDASETDLARYLILAHHGQLRMRVGGLGDDSVAAEILGLRQGAASAIPAMLGQPAGVLTVDLAQFSAPVFGNSVRPWASVAAELLSRFGPFRLAYLETVVRIADWRASGGRELTT